MRLVHITNGFHLTFPLFNYGFPFGFVLLNVIIVLNELKEANNVVIQ